MELLPALHLSSIVVRYSNLVGNLATVASVAKTQPEDSQLQHVHDQLSKIMSGFQDVFIKLNKGRGGAAESKFAAIYSCAVFCARDCKTILGGIEASIQKTTTCPETGIQYAAMLDRVFAPDSQQGLRTRINEHVLPEAFRLASDIMQHALSQLQDARQHFGSSITAESADFQKLQSSASLLQVQLGRLGRVSCGTKTRDDFFDKLTQLLSDLEHVQKTMLVLHEIDYSERLQRHDRISEAHRGTLAWVLNQDHGDDPSNSSSSLGSWLTCGERLAWVTGNPGSGKSTLMKFVADHQNTRKLLKTWAGDREVLVISHYFDALGTPNQKSLEKLLRSFVYGILSAKPTLGSELLPNAWEVLSTASLSSGFGLASFMGRIANFQVNVCFFIDGLDEYGGEYAHLCQLITNIASLPFVKICVSSNTLPVFENELGNLCETKLALHKVNRDDIYNYVKDQIYQRRTPSSGSSYEQSGAIADKSQGIFLWAVLAIRLPLNIFSHFQSYEDIPCDLSELVRLTMESVDLRKHEAMAGSLIMARNERFLPAEIFFFHQTGHNVEDLPFSFSRDKELLLSGNERSRSQIFAANIRLRLKQMCNDLLEVHDGAVVFMHRVIFDLMYNHNISQSLLRKAGRDFDSDLSVFKASMSWFKQRRYQSGELQGLKSAPRAISLAYRESLIKFLDPHSDDLLGFLDPLFELSEVYALSRAVSFRGGYDSVCRHSAWLSVAQDLGYTDETALSVAETFKYIYKTWIRPYEKHMYHQRLGESDPMEDILDLADSLKLSLRFARRCDQKKPQVASVTWAILDDAEENLLAMAGRGQYNTIDLSMIRGIYRHLIIEAGIEGYLKKKVLEDPGYFDNEYSKAYRSPLYSALGVTPRFLCAGKPRARDYNKWLVEGLLILGHDPNKTYRGGETPFSAFVDQCIPDALCDQPLQFDGLSFRMDIEMLNLMLHHGANSEAYTEVRDQKARKWRVPVWFKLLKLAPCVETPYQDMFERVFSMILERSSTLPHAQALLELKSGGETFQWIPYPIWKICKDNFELHRITEGSSPSDAYFVFRIFSKVCERTAKDLETSHCTKQYLSHCFWPNYPELAHQMSYSTLVNESRTVGRTTNSSFTPGDITESLSCRISTSATSIELPEIGVDSGHQKGGGTDDSYIEPHMEDENIDDVCSIQSIDDDIQSIISSIARTPHTIAAERQVGDLLSRHPDIHFILDASGDIMPKDRLKRNLRRSLKLLYLELRKEAQDNVQVQVLTTRMLKGRGSRTRISERAVDDKFAVAPLENENQDQGSRLDFRKDREFLDTWFSQVQLSQRLEDDSLKPQLTDDIMGETATESGHGTSEDSSSDSEEFQAVQLAQDFLMNGAPFIAFLTHLGLSLLPDHLRQVMQLASWDNIELIDTPFEISTFDQIKSFTENLTGSPWNWWPMKSPKVPLRRGYIRMNWRCHCGKPFWVDVTPTQARIIGRMVDNPTSFVNNHCKATHSGQNVFQKVTGWFSWNSNTLLPVSVSSSQANQPSASSRGINSQAQRETITTTSSHSPPEAAEGLRILFGVPMGLKTLHVIPIPVKQQPGDKVFPLLQEQYRRIRGRWRAWFSFWQLSHCDFVKFESIARNVVVACGQDLPKANDLDYDYTPKPPQASIPLVHPHVFEAAFNSCAEGKCRYPFPFHDCYEFEETAYIQRIPKKKTPLSSGVNDIPIWGLEARHCISCIHVILYHLLILIPPFALWGWWLSLHPDDIQSASVPMTVVLAMISMFWSATGIVKQFRGEL
ncbi:related to small s protein [Fusarium torulosum]|uniref:Related to small s protein n=1 Tax=Fusarium torulosum TaxID=33205 RepID=A0AAE8SP49_9HYPO|nr:related to small s protein [Fusarium torulosum]